MNENSFQAPLTFSVYRLKNNSVIMYRIGRTVLTFLKSLAMSILPQEEFKRVTQTITGFIRDKEYRLFRADTAILYKSAFLGCGGRARGHPHAYQHVKGSEIGAICDMNEQLLNDFGDDFSISKRYTDRHQMLDQGSLDLLHIVTLLHYAEQVN